MIFSRLLTSLPRDWQSFKSAWSTRSEDQKSLASLIELIRSEAARRAIEDGVLDVTTLMARVGLRRRGGRRPSGRPFIQRRYFKTRHQLSYLNNNTMLGVWSTGTQGKKLQISSKTSKYRLLKYFILVNLTLGSSIHSEQSVSSRASRTRG